MQSRIKSKSQESKVKHIFDTQMQRLVAVSVIRQYHGQREAKRLEANYVLRAEAQAEQDYQAYQRFLKERGFEQALPEGWVQL
jgi:hypothetical protein